MSNSVIHIQNIVKKYGSTTAVNNITLDIQDGDFFALLGPSGCGKTTLLRMIGGFDHPTSGRILMDGKDITPLPPHQRHTNMLFQSYAVFPHMTVEQNVGYGLRMEKRPPHEIATRVAEALTLVRMEEYAKRRPDHLSGGQRQRVALARALIKKPRVLLLDEPLSALDAKLREAMQTELVRLQQTVGITFIVVTHDQDEALSMANRVAVMKNGELMQTDAPRNLYEAPQTRFVADFIGRMNMHPCTLTETSDTTQRITAADIGDITLPHPPLPNTPAGSQIHYGVRPEKVQFTPTPPATGIHIPATIESHSYHGDETLLYCRTPTGAQWTSTQTNSNRDHPSQESGQPGHLTWHPENIILLKE